MMRKCINKSSSPFKGGSLGALQMALFCWAIFSSNLLWALDRIVPQTFFDIASLRIEIAATASQCLSGDTLIIPLPAGVYFSSIPDPSTGLNDTLLAIPTTNSCETITINGASKTATFLKGGGVLRVLDIHPLPGKTRVVNINNLSINNGKAQGFGGGLFIRPGAIQVFMNNTRVADNSAIGASGGGIALAVGTSLAVRQSQFSGNKADENGGAIFNFGGFVTLDSATNFSGNSANNAGSTTNLGGSDTFGYNDIVLGPSLANLTTSEAGSSASLNLQLLHKIPSGQSVTIAPSSLDQSEGTVLPSSLIFNSTNWDVPQVVTISGVDDSVDDGNQSFQVSFGGIGSIITTSSGQPENTEKTSIDLINTDDDTAGIKVTTISGHTNEDGGQATFTVVLESKPTAAVSLTMQSSDLGEGTVLPTQISFPKINWNVPSLVTVTGVDDQICDGNQTFSIIINPATSSDPLYNGLDAVDVLVVNDHSINDLDFDLIGDCVDNCLGVYNPNQTDPDNDGVGDFCDNCPNDYNPLQLNATPSPAPGDPGDACDPTDSDGDGLSDMQEAACGSNPADPNSRCLALPWLLLLN